jgi:hypothetical protein
MTQGLLVTFQGPRSWPTRSSPAHSPLQEAARPPPSQALALCACPPLLVRRSPHHRCRQLASRRVQRAPPSSGCAGVAGQRLLPHHQRSSSSSRIGEKRGPRLKTRGQTSRLCKAGARAFSDRVPPISARLSLRPAALTFPPNAKLGTFSNCRAYRSLQGTDRDTTAASIEPTANVHDGEDRGAQRSTRRHITGAHTLSHHSARDLLCWHRSPVVAALIHSGVPPLPMAAPPTHSPACSH